MPVKFFNTFTRQLEEFVPIEERTVRLYTCGPTVYNYAHIGNLRTYTFEDVLRRWLEYRGYQVCQVMNITDVEDKIIRAHRATGQSIEVITAPFIQAFFEDLETLNIEKAEHYPRATAYIDQMVEMTQSLIAKGYAYRSEDGSVYFAISRFPAYGHLSHMKMDELVAGARVKHDEYEKESASDFALWKAWDEHDGDVAWETPLGKGRPGWHLECSVMSTQLLGEHFDIHTGGEDNIFPHHENEIAQSEAATGQRFVNYWLHSRHLLVDETKMAKSKGNFYTLRDLVHDKGLSWRAIRYLYISSHYRSLLNFSLEGVDAAQRAVDNLFEFLRRVRDLRRVAGDALESVTATLDQGRTDFEAAMDDDLNTPEALGAIFTTMHHVNRWVSDGVLRGADAQRVIDFFLSADRLLGLKMEEALVEETLDADIDGLVQERQDARARKDFARADAIRGQLRDMGIVLEDTPVGVRWRRA